LLTLQPDYLVEQTVFRSLEFERVHTIQYYPFRLDSTVHREPIDVNVLTAIVDETVVLFYVFYERILLSEVSVGLVYHVAVFDSDDVLWEFNQAEFFAVVVDTKLLALVDVNAVDESEFAHCWCVRVGLGLDGLHPKPKLRRLLLLHLVLVEVEVERVFDAVRDEVELEVGAVVEGVEEGGGDVEFVVDVAEPVELYLLGEDDEEA